MMKKTATKRNVLILFLLIFVAIAVWVAPKLYQVYQVQLREEELRQARIEYPFLDDTVVIQHYQGKDYYVAKKPYEGEHDIQEIDYEWNHITLPDGTKEYYAQKIDFQEVYFERPDGISGYMTEPVVDPEGKKYSTQQLQEVEALRVMDYKEYAAFCEEWEIAAKYTDPDLNYIVRNFYTEDFYYDRMFCGVQYEGSTAKLYVHESITSSVVASATHIFIIPTDQDVDTVEVIQIYSEEEYENILKFGQIKNPNDF